MHPCTEFLSLAPFWKSSVTERKHVDPTLTKDSISLQIIAHKNWIFVRCPSVCSLVDMYTISFNNSFISLAILGNIYQTWHKAIVCEWEFKFLEMKATPSFEGKHFRIIKYILAFKKKISSKNIWPEKKFETCVNATSGNVDLEFVQIMSPEGRVGPQWRIKPNTCREQKLKLVWGIIIKWGGVGWIGLHWDIIFTLEYGKIWFFFL